MVITMEAEMKVKMIIFKKIMEVIPVMVGMITGMRAETVEMEAMMKTAMERKMTTTTTIIPTGKSGNTIPTTLMPLTILRL
jgi:putative alpha-1,2-mannosidase